MEKLKEEIRQPREIQQTQARQIKILEFHLIFGSEVELQNQDYAQARSRSIPNSCARDRLLRDGRRPNHPRE
jgi:hypothetical protein